MFGPKPKIDRAQPLYMQADQLIYDTKGNRVIAQGNVEIYYNNFILTADQVIYDQNLNKLIARRQCAAQGPERLASRAPTGSRRSTISAMPSSSRSASSRRTTRASPPTGPSAAKAMSPSSSAASSRRARTTRACRRCGASARRASCTISRRRRITYQDAQFELFGVPIFYLPYFQHPDPSVKRRSGFLMPSHSNSSTLGYSVEMPYYFALAPNCRLHLPSALLQPSTACCGRASGATGWPTASTPSSWPRIDDDTARCQSTTQGWRGSIETKGQFSLSSWWRYGWDVTVESDDSFRRFYQLDPILQTDRVNTAYLQGMSERNYFGAKLYQFGGLLLERLRRRQLARASGDRLQLHRGHARARRRAELHRARPRHDAHRRHQHQPRRC